MDQYKHKIMLKCLIPFLLLFSWRVDSGQSQGIQTKEKMVSKFSGRVPKEWGERVKGVKTRFHTDQKVIAFTFDACGGPKGNGYDDELIRYLENEKIYATLFVSGRWIDVHLEVLKRLAKNPLFDIENHGLHHRPCSTTGRSAYGIEGTKNVGEIYDEIEGNALKIQNLTGRKPNYYRPGTAYCDEICVEIAQALGYEVVSFNIRGDAGATYSKRQVKDALLKATSSSIVLMHMNHPECQTAEGLIETIPELKKRGFRFVKLSQYPLR